MEAGACSNYTGGSTAMQYRQPPPLLRREASARATRKRACAMGRLRWAIQFVCSQFGWRAGGKHGFRHATAAHPEPQLTSNLSVLTSLEAEEAGGGWVQVDWVQVAVQST